MNDAATGCCDLGCFAIDAAPKAVPSCHIYGHLRLLDCGKGRYEVDQREGDEFFVTIGNIAILPCHGMQTDLGSIPRPVQMIVAKDSYNKGFIPHDACYYYRYVLRSRCCHIGDVQLKYLRAAAHIHDEDDRLHILAPAFDLLPIKDRNVADDWLDLIVSTLSKGNAKRDRAIIRAGLWIGSRFPWYFGKYAKRMDYLKRHALRFPIHVVEQDPPC